MAKIKATVGINDLATTHPEIAAQWDYENNGGVTPQDITAGSRFKASWVLPYNDPKTGKVFIFKWQTVVSSRTLQNLGCPFLSGREVYVGFNDLATTHPELAAQWDYDNNNGLTPQDVTSGCNKPVSWVLPYDDPKTGKHFDFKWQAYIYHRVNSKRSGCPYLYGRTAWPGFNDLATTHPELTKEWHPTKNGDLTPQAVTAGSHMKVWWLLSYDDHNTGKHFDFEWQATVGSRALNNRSCPFISNPAVSIYVGFNDLATTHPELAAQWHPTKNGTLTPQDVMAGSGKMVWWYLPYDDPKTGKHFDFEWSTILNMRALGEYGCPYLSGKAVWPGFNDLTTTHPELAAQWHPTKNGKRTAQDVTAGSGRKIWWYLPYDDPKTGKHFDFEWEEKPVSRISHKGLCPFLTNYKVWPGFNDLATTYPELAAQWDYENNGIITPQNIIPGSRYKAHWILPYNDPKTGKHFEFKWISSVVERAISGRNCPFTSNPAVAIYVGFNDLATTHPELAAQWHPTKNGTLTPQEVMAGSNRKAWWYLPYDDPKTGKHFDFEWSSIINLRALSEYGCPYLSGKAVWHGFNDLATTHPELAAQWHPNKNGNLTPQDVTAGSSIKAWWCLPYMDPKTDKNYVYEWKALIYSRSAGIDCPLFSSSATERLISSILKDNGIKFVAEKRFEQTGLCKFDFFIETHDCIIEPDGKQHFINIFRISKEDFEAGKQRDRNKNLFCLDENKPILRIPYIYDAKKDRKEIKEIVLKFLVDFQVPDEILEFYAQYKDNNYYEVATKLNKINRQKRRSA